MNFDPKNVASGERRVTPFELIYRGNVDFIVQDIHWTVEAPPSSGIPQGEVTEPPRFIVSWRCGTLCGVFHPGEQPTFGATYAGTFNEIALDKNGAQIPFVYIDASYLSGLAQYVLP